MSNLNQTQAEWTRVEREFGFLLGVDKYLDDVGRKFDSQRNRTQVVEQNSVNAFTSLWTLSGVVVGTNTDETGTLFVRITDENPSSAHALVELYKAAGAGGSDKVATGSAADGGTVTLAAANSSGITGTVKLATVSASETDDKHRLLVLPDFLLRARSIFDGSKPEHGAILGGIISAFSRMQNQITSAQTQWQTVLNAFILGRVANFTGSGQSQPITQGTVNSNGAITTTTTGVLEDFRSAMVDEGNAGAQTVVKNVVTASSPVADAHNVGQGSLTTPAMAEWASAGTITLICTNATIGSETFSVTQRVAATNQTLVSKNSLTIKRVFADPVIGIVNMTLTRTHLLASGSTNDFGLITSWVINGESASNTSSGLIYMTLAVNPNNAAQWQVLGYSDSARTQQVFYTDFGAANGTVNLYGIGTGAGFSGTAILGSAPTTAHTGTLNLQTFVTQNSGTPGVPDKFTIAVAVSSVGQFQTRIAEFFNYAINSAASGAQTINEGLASAATFVPYSVLDA